MVDAQDGFVLAVKTYRTGAEELKLGMTLLGLVFSSILYGITLSQAYTYYRNFPRDPRVVKIMVVAMTLLDTISAVFITHSTWYYLVTTGSIKVSIWSLNSEMAVSMLISALTEMFLTYRVWMLSNRNHPLALFLFSLALLHFVIGEVCAVQLFQLKYFSRFSEMMITSILRLGSAALCDTCIAIALCYFLQKKRTGFKRTDRIIDHLMVFSINSGLVTSVTSASCLVTYLLVPTTWVYLALCFLISRLYAITFLSSLNSRQVLQNYSDSSSNTDPQTARIPFFKPPAGPDPPSGTIRSMKAAQGHIDILVSREVISRIDSNSNESAPSYGGSSY